MGFVPHYPSPKALLSSGLARDGNAWPRPVVRSSKLTALTSALLIFGLAACQQSSSTSAAANVEVRDTSTTTAVPSWPYEINSNGLLARPKGYRSWVYVGTPVTPNDMNNGKAPFPEFHNVYIDPTSYTQYKKTGSWRDGTILVKELVSVGTKAANSGNGYFMGDFIGLEATIKSATHFPDEPGNWAYFSFTDLKSGVLAAEVSAFPTTSCNSCHEAGAQDDFVFTQYYPVLASAKGHGAASPEDSAQRTAVKRP